MRFLDQYVIRLSWWSLKKIYRILIVASMGSIMLGILAFSFYMRSLPSLSTLAYYTFRK